MHAIPTFFDVIYVYQNSSFDADQVADSVLAVQAARTQHQVQLRNLRRPEVHGLQGIVYYTCLW
jgi:hypothetical protein